MQGGLASYHLTARRLLDPDSRDRIKRQNAHRNSKYPRHQAWIERALEALANDDYSRMAFGVYLHVDDLPSVLCCSVIVSVNAFAPHLELKNLTVFGDELPDDLRHRQFESDCILTVIRHVQRFASDRGYRKLVTEVFRDGDQDRHVTQCFLERGFSVVGNQSGRYLFSDEVLYLAWDVFAAYGYDPFDYDAASRWLVETHLPEAQPSRVIKVRLFINGKSRSIEKNVQILQTGRGSSISSKKLGDEVGLVVVEDYFGQNHGIRSIDLIQFDESFDGRMLLFDYSYVASNWVKQLSDLLSQQVGRLRILERTELVEMLYGATGQNKAMRRLASLPKSLSVNNVDCQRYLPKRDDRCGKVV
jgi:hypothetical protein